MGQSTQVPTSVYRYYDQSGILIYVGITSRGMIRQAEHNGGKEWWGFVTRQEVEHYPSRGEAMARERELIEHHCPPFNKQHNWAHEAIRAAYMALRENRKKPATHAEAVKALHHRLELDVHGFGPRDNVILRTRLDDVQYADLLALPQGKPPRVFGFGRKEHTVLDVIPEGPFVLLHLSTTSRHPVADAHALVRLGGQQDVAVRSVHVELDHSDPSHCNKMCRRRLEPPREIRWVRADDEGRESLRRHHNRERAS